MNLIDQMAEALRDCRYEINDLSDKLNHYAKRPKLFANMTQTTTAICHYSAVQQAFFDVRKVKDKINKALAAYKEREWIAVRREDVKSAVQHFEKYIGELEKTPLMHGHSEENLRKKNHIVAISKTKNILSAYLIEKEQADEKK